MRVLRRRKACEKIFGNVGVRQRCVGDVDDRRGAYDRDFRFQLGRRQHHVNRGGHADVNGDADDLGGGEPAQGRFNDIRPREKRRDAIAPFFVGNSRRLSHDAWGSRCDCDPGKRGPRVICDRALDRRRFPGLSWKEPGGQGKDQKTQYPKPL